MTTHSKPQRFSSRSLRITANNPPPSGFERFDKDEISKFANSNSGSLSNYNFDLVFDSYCKVKSGIVESKFRMSLTELLEECDGV